MKYKVGDSFLAKATIESVDPKRRAPYFLIQVSDADGGANQH